MYLEHIQQNIFFLPSPGEQTLYTSILVSLCGELRSMQDREASWLTVPMSVVEPISSSVFQKWKCLAHLNISYRLCIPVLNVVASRYSPSSEGLCSHGVVAECDADSWCSSVLSTPWYRVPYLGQDWFVVWLVGGLGGVKRTGRPMTMSVMSVDGRPTPGDASSSPALARTDVFSGQVWLMETPWKVTQSQSSGRDPSQHLVEGGWRLSSGGLWTAWRGLSGSEPDHAAAIGSGMTDFMPTWLKVRFLGRSFSVGSSSL